MSLFNATKDEADQFKNQPSGIALRILRKQPPKGAEFKLIYHEEDSSHKGAKFYNEQTDEAHYIRLRCPPGLYDVKETWGKHRSVVPEQNYDEMEYIYKADDPHHECDFHSPITMPAEAIRWKDVQFETTVKRVQELTKDEIEKSGLIFCPGTGHFSSCYGVWIGKKGTRKCKYTSNMDSKYVFKVAWNSLHGKPIKQDKRYVCYPYDNSKESMARYDKYLMGDFWYINDKPLIIIDNTYLEVISWKKSGTPTTIENMQQNS